MKFKGLRLLLCTMALAALSFPQSAFGSWAGFSTEEMFEQADVILIGNIKEPIGEERIFLEGGPYWYTEWKVESVYYLKGDVEDSEMSVKTLGAANKNVSSSNDYRLDNWESPVLLFLRKRDGFYEPLSPQGVISVRKVAHVQVEPYNRNGSVISMEFDIPDSQIENYISEHIPKVKVPTVDSSVKGYSLGTFTLLVPLLVVLIIVPFYRKLG